MLDMVISGGQTGVDYIALWVARSLNIPTGGMAPRGWRTENGPNLELESFGLVESSFTDYTYRTRHNALSSDGTLILGDTSSEGTAQTIRILEANKKPYIINPTAKEFVEWMTLHQISVLNVAGNRGSKLSPMKIVQIQDYLKEVLSLCYKPINA